MTEIYLESWQLVEIARCIKSPEYFIETYCWLQQKASAGVSEEDSILPFVMGRTPDEPHYFQRKILRWLHQHKNVLTLKSRRVGCSWIAAGYAAWMVNFFPNTNILFISRNGAEAKKILAKVRFILKNLALHDHADLRKATRAPWLRGEFASDNQERIAVAWKDDSGEVTTISEVVSLNNTDDSARGDDATFVVFDELAFYEHPDDTWASAIMTLARGGQWMAISTPNGIGDVFHRMCEQGDLAERGLVPEEELGYKYIKIHWSEAGITPEQVQKTSGVLTEEKASQEWEFHFITPGSVVFHPTHLAQCFKSPEDYPEVAKALTDYREKVTKKDGAFFYYTGCDTIVGKAHKKSKEKDWNAFVAVTKSGIVAHVETNQVALSKWAGMTVDGSEYPGQVTELHAQWPGILQVEEEGPGYTVINRYQFPGDSFSEMHPVSMKHLVKRGIIQRLILKVEAHSIVITDLRLYQQMQVFQQLDVGKYGAPLGYHDDLVIAFALALDALDKHGSLSFPWGDTTDKLKRTSMTAIMGEPMVELGQGPVMDYQVPEQYRRQSDFVMADMLPSTDDLGLPYDILIEDLLTDVPR